MKNIHKFNENIYIVSQEEIKEGDWCLVLNFKKEYLIEKYSFHSDCIIAKKIIITSDQDLIKDGIQAIDDEFLEWFVRNPSCEFVEVKAIYDSGWNYGYKIIIPKEQDKKMYSEEEVIKFGQWLSEFNNLDNESEYVIKELLRRFKNKQDMKQTAMEWLEFRYKNNITLNQYDFEQAKEMERQQIIDAYNENENYMCDGTEGEQYYNETFNK